jgi:hypothetical protein
VTLATLRLDVAPTGVKPGQRSVADGAEWDGKHGLACLVQTDRSLDGGRVVEVNTLTVKPAGVMSHRNEWFVVVGAHDVPPVLARRSSTGVNTPKLGAT